MATVIDQFVIKVKLDTSEYEAGQKKLDKLSQQTKEKAVEAGNAFGDAISSGASKASGKLGVLGSMLGKGGMIGIAVGSLIYAGKLIDTKLFDIAKGVRQVGIDSKNFNIAAANLRNLQNASEMVGGSIEDANKTVGGLAGSLYNLKFNGAVDDSLIALGRLGVHFQDSYGHAKDFNAVMLETADAIDKAKASGKMSDSEAFFFAGQAGFTGGMQNLVTSGGANVRAELARQAARKQIDAGNLATSTHMVTASTSLGQAATAEGGLRLVEKYGDTRANAQEFLEKSGQGVIDFLSSASDELDEFGKSLVAASNRLDTFLGVSSGSTGKVSSAILDPFGMYHKLFGISDSEDSSGPGDTRAARNHNPFNIRAVGNQPHDDKGFRVFNSDNEAIAAADHQLGLYDKRGINTVGGIISTWAPPNENNTAQYIAQMSKATNMSASHVVAPEERAQLLSAMAMKESSTTISIGDINVNSQSGDMHGVANETAAAVKRKMLTAHAERGAQ
jgi:hypothetical protein